MSCMKMSPSRMANIIAKNEWSSLVRAKAGDVCEICGRTGKLDAHHIFRKQSNYMKTLLSNGIALCFNCHRNGIHSPDWKDQRIMSDKIQAYKGEEEMERLNRLKHNPPKLTLDELKEIRKDYAQMLNEY
jgi:hypothetical protein